MNTYQQIFLFIIFTSKSWWRDGFWIGGAPNVNDMHDLGMRNARLLHKDLLPEVGCQDFELYKGSSLALFKLDKEKVKVPGKDRVFL